MELDELTYSRGQLSTEQIQQEIAKFWAELGESAELQAELAAAGIDLDLLGGYNATDAITVRVDSSGVDPVSVSLIIVFAPTANRVMKDVWTTVLPSHASVAAGATNLVKDKKPALEP